MTVFRHFGSKEELFGKVIGTYSFLPALKDMLPLLSDMQYEDALREVAGKYIERLYERKDFIRIMLSESHLYPEKAKSLHRNFLDEMARTLASYIRGMQEKGGLRDLDPELSARAFLGMFFSYFIAREFHRVKGLQKVDPERVIEEFVEIFSRGTKKK